MKMKLGVSVFEYLNQKVMYIQDVNYYFGIKDSFDIKLGDYELSEKEVLKIAKENDPEEYDVFVNTSIKERIEKINIYNIDEIKEESSHGQFTLCLHPSRKCNLNCNYCFKESEYLGKEQLTFEVAKDAIDFLVDKYAPCASKYVIDLSGSGEPLLQIDLIKQIVDYCKQKRNEICKNIEVMFCTNLTLLTPEIVDYLDNEPAIILGTSIDGDQITNDNNRVYANGKGTYNDIIEGLKRFKNKKLGLAVTITPLNQDVDLIYDHLYHLPNVDCVSMKFIRSFDGSKYDFDNFDIAYLISRYEKLCNNIFNELDKDNFDYLEKLLQGADFFGMLIIQNIFKGTFTYFRCDAGKNRFSINPKGDIFACSVMNGNEEFNFGNIYSQVNKKLQNKFFVPNINSNSKCQDCEIKYLCGGECYANSFLRYNNLYYSIDKMCEIKRKLNRLSISFILNLKSNYNNIYIKFVDFIFLKENYTITNSTVFSLLTFFKYKKIDMSYTEINNNFFTKNDISPVEIINYIKNYTEINAYRITDYNKMNYPAISIINQKETNLYEYEVIVGCDKENFLIKNYLNSTDSYTIIPVDVYIKRVSSIFIM